VAQAIAKLAFKVVFSLTKAGVPYGLVAGTFKVAAFITLNAITNKLFGPKIPDSEGLRGRDVMVASSVEYRKIVYGETVVSGPIWYNNVSNDPSGDPGLERLWYCIALCEGQSEDLVSVWIDDIEIPKADIAWTAGTGSSDGTGTGEVSTASLVGENSTPGAYIWYYLGDPDQPVSGVLNTEFDDIDTTHRGRGITPLIVRCDYKADTEEVWESGPPRNIKAVIQGRKLYDPRKYLRSAEQNLIARLSEAFEDLGSKGQSIAQA